MLPFPIRNNINFIVGLLLFVTHFGFPQIILSGKITEAQSGIPVPFASVIIGNKHFGTLSNEQGDFRLKLPYITTKDTLKFSAIGYETQSYTGDDIKKMQGKVISLVPAQNDLNEIKINPNDVKKKTLGTKNYSKENCTAFISEEDNWLGSQAAIKAGNKKGRNVYIESFSFYIIKNEYSDSLRFRVMLYGVSPAGYPSKTFLKRSVIFKTAIKQGEVKIDLKEHYITTDDDFFISLECLEENMDERKFCFAGSVNVPSYAKTRALNYWKYVKGGGADLNVTVSYLKE